MGKILFTYCTITTELYFYLVKLNLNIINIIKLINVIKNCHCHIDMEITVDFTEDVTEVITFVIE
jgi:hypothetical protein